MRRSRCPQVKCGVFDSVFAHSVLPLLHFLNVWSLVEVAAERNVIPGPGSCLPVCMIESVFSGLYPTKAWWVGGVVPSGVECMPPELVPRRAHGPFWQHAQHIRNTVVQPLCYWHRVRGWLWLCMCSVLPGHALEGLPRVLDSGRLESRSAWEGECQLPGGSPLRQLLACGSHSCGAVCRVPSTRGRCSSVLHPVRQALRMVL